MGALYIMIFHPPLSVHFLIRLRQKHNHQRVHICHHHPHHHHHHHYYQALSQFLAILVTLGFAVVGGVITGLIMHQVDPLFGLVVLVADVSVIGVVDGVVNHRLTSWIHLLLRNYSTTRETSIT